MSTYRPLNAQDVITALGYNALSGAISTANLAILSELMTAFFASLPITLPSSSGVLWNNGGVLSLS